MQLHRLLLLTFVIFINIRLHGQDIHFTQFGFVPLTINPAQAGLFEGTYRIGGLYRSQWLSGISGTYRTPVLFTDLPISGLRKTDWIGLGLNIHQDRAGSAALRTNLIGINGAYHIGFDKKYASVLSIGLQANFNQRNVDKEALRFQDAILGGGISADQTAITAQNRSYADVNFGFNYRGKPDKKTTYNIGASVEHILSPENNLIEGKEQFAKVPMRINIYGGADLTLSKTLSFSPAVIFRLQRSFTETMLQAVAGLKIDQKKNTVIKGGLGYRVGDAIQFLAGAELGDLRVGLGYDFTASKVRSNARVQDGFELAIGYIGKIYKTQKPTPVILCPRY